MSGVVIRPYRDEDRDAIVALAPRLTEGVAAWRDADAVAAAVRDWVTGSLDRHGSDGHGALVADRDGPGSAEQAGTGSMIRRRQRSPAPSRAA
ncbi:hypothetical protein [Nonomuraea roseoviolacea]|uniref:GNAT family N-acetyltransferase n=1 Tax=Nonomuraea roseoviolacea subsp. carminata TaxID=160689 RepID=A0ABT1K5Z5_9ACTN|nr:hypothetical protein [Nonomuraea roseoviolacea]MCP2349428.1 hypothetical protein [Nonomuraea roseoviolacea subsp. carminata]